MNAQSVYGNGGGAGGASVTYTVTYNSGWSWDRKRNHQARIDALMQGEQFVFGHSIAYISEPYMGRFVWECACGSRGKKLSVSKTNAMRLHAEHALRNGKLQPSTFTTKALNFQVQTQHWVNSMLASHQPGKIIAVSGV